MGKVKKTFWTATGVTVLVSIPYGKGKVDIHRFFASKIYRFQFPMGKVKNNILCCVLSIHHKYRFVKKKYLLFL